MSSSIICLKLYSVGQGRSSFFLLLKSKVLIAFLATCLLLLAFPMQASASVEAFVAKCKDDSYHQYSYDELLDSYAMSLLGSPGILYEDFKAKTTIALLGSDGSYVDYSNVLKVFASALLKNEHFSLSSYTNSNQAIKAVIPNTLQVVTTKSGRLVREALVLGQGGLDQDNTNIVADKLQTITPIVGIASVTLEKAQQWAKNSGAHQRFIDIAPLYWDYGSQSGIRPEVLYAQAALETGFGRYGGQVLPEYNNWAGIKTAGASGDEPEDHEQFATPADGVRAHFNHMSAYLGLNPIGEPHARYHRVKNITWAGSVTLVEELSGKWAPSPTYHERIVDMIAKMQ